MSAAPPGRPRYRTVALWALAGTALGVLLTLVDLRNTQDINGWLVHVGPGHPSYALIERELPDEPRFERGSHDGAQFYAIARYGLDVRGASAYLDRPLYRLQRPLFPYLARIGWPPGTGVGMVWAMFAVGVLGMYAAAFGAAGLAQACRGRLWPALVVPVLPGSILALRISVGDTLAVGLVLLAGLALVRDRPAWAAVAGTGAVLGKEAMLITLVGYVLWSRRARDLWAVAVPAAAAAAWWLFLRTQLPGEPTRFEEFSWPFGGIADSVRWSWFSSDALAFATVLLVVAMSAVALVRHRLDHPLTWALVLNLAFIPLLSVHVIGLDRNAPRALLPAFALATIMLATPVGAAVGRPPRALNPTDQAATSAG